MFPTAVVCRVVLCRRWGGVTLARRAMLRVLVVSSAASEPTAVRASLLATALWRMNYGDG